jgi:hypothetical protein
MTATKVGLYTKQFDKLVNWLRLLYILTMIYQLSNKCRGKKSMRKMLVFTERYRCWLLGSLSDSAKKSPLLKASIEDFS